MEPWALLLATVGGSAAAIANTIASDIIVAQIEPNFLVPKNSIEHGIIENFFQSCIVWINLIFTAWPFFQTSIFRTVCHQVRKISRRLYLRWTGLIYGVHKGKLLIGHTQDAHLDRHKGGEQIGKAWRYTGRLHIGYIQNGHRWDTHMTGALRRQSQQPNLFILEIYRLCPHAASARKPYSTFARHYHFHNSCGLLVFSA